MQTKYLPFTTIRADGVHAIRFPLNEHTSSDRHVACILEAVLETVNDQIGLHGDVSDGDVLQALCMALAVRMHRVKAPAGAVRALVATALEQADDAVAEGREQQPGNA